MGHFIKTYKKKKGKDLRKDVRSVQKLRREALPPLNNVKKTALLAKYGFPIFMCDISR